jgi:hypothetical protein
MGTLLADATIQEFFQREILVRPEAWNSDCGAISKHGSEIQLDLREIAEMCLATCALSTKESLQ